MKPELAIQAFQNGFYSELASLDESLLFKKS